MVQMKNLNLQLKILQLILLHSEYFRYILFSYSLMNTTYSLLSTFLYFSLDVYSTANRF